MTTCARIQNHLSDCLDGTADAAVQSTVAAHLDACDTCAAIYRDLDAIGRAARSLPPVIPPARVWQSLAAKLERESARSQPEWSAGWWHVAAAIIAVAATAYVTVHFDRARVRPAPDGNAVASRVVEPAVDNVDRTLANWETALGDLERASQATRGTMDPAITGAFTAHLSAIDAAIRESRAAVTDQPDSEPARDNLIDAYQRKATVLQIAIDAGTDRNP